MENKEIRRQNLRLLKQRFGTLRSLAEATGTDAATLSQINTGHRDMGDDIAYRLEDGAGLPRGWIDTLHATSPDAVYQATVRPVPVVGTAQLGDDGYWLETEHPTGYGEGFIRYPTKDENAYALRVKGDSMRPRIKPGEFVIIEPNRSIAPGEEVMVKTKDGRCMVKVLGHRRNGIVELLSINEDHRPISIEEDEVDRMHYVAAIVKASLYYRDIAS